MIIISFFLEGILSKCIYSLIPLFTLTSLVSASYYLKEEKIIKYSLIIGILYDITYTNTIILNGLLFFFLSTITIYFNKNYNKKIINLLLINIIIIILYLLLTYFILILFKYIDFNFIYLITTIFKSIITNTIYILILNIKKIYHHKI